MTASQPSSDNGANQRILDFLRREAPKAHSADDLAALLGLEAAQVQAALEAMHAAQQVVPEAVSGYGGSATLWTVTVATGTES
ncbi:MarR family transcriptional regulator [Deinococcus cavernae]|uniref:MarR family transcriptional regulator n=1 Tax=Deinococcus cavernae TaxID=2320857 RepID=A0A418V8P1_9DEIO|nr:MarR family transcriptional regulator [Deinococcus cavernae]RJF72464.1 MarR family transcriptional regulator [Deinococcus cavernae]